MELTFDFSVVMSALSPLVLVSFSKIFCSIMQFRSIELNIAMNGFTHPHES